MKDKLMILFLFMTINLSFAQLNCYQQNNGLYQYYAKLENIPNLNSNFNKTDFMNYVTTYGNMTTVNLSTLNTSVILVSKSFPTSQTPFLQNVVSIDSDSDIYPIILNSNNSVTTIECRGNPILLNVQNFEKKNLKLNITKNPIDETSKIVIDPKVRFFKIVITNTAGQIIYENQFKSVDSIFLNEIILDRGLYILTVTDLDDNRTESLKLIK